MTALRKALKENFGLSSFREGQEDIITAVLNQHDVLAILPTGGGKTLCYHLPAKLTNGITLVISPLVSLMEDQVTQMKASGDKDVAHLSSLLSREEHHYTMRHLHTYKLLFLSPEMVMFPPVLGKLQKMKVALFAVDEVHCISQWGHEFRTDYLKLKDVKEKLGSPPCLALTATATKQVERDVIYHLNMKNESVFRFPVNRENIYLVSRKAANPQEKDQYFLKLMEHIDLPCLVYTGTRHMAETVSHRLQKSGYRKCAYYHGGLSKEDKILIQQQFLNNELDIICCTNAFGMGINKPNVRSVIHLHLPLSVEQYVQETGRAGRDGKQSLAFLLFSEEDSLLPASLIDQEFPDEKWLDAILATEELGGEKITELDMIQLMDETMRKMLIYYLEHEKIVVNGRLMQKDYIVKELPKIKSRFKSRKQEKLMQFSHMERLALSNKCLRKSISRFFDEEKGDSPYWCCSNCHSFNTFKRERDTQYEWYTVENDQRETYKEPWQEKLKRILISENEGGSSD